MRNIKKYKNSRVNSILEAIYMRLMIVLLLVFSIFLVGCLPNPIVVAPESEEVDVPELAAEVSPDPVEVEYIPLDENFPEEVPVEVIKEYVEEEPFFEEEVESNVEVVYEDFPEEELEEVADLDEIHTIEIMIAGRDGFDPLHSVIKKGDTVSFSNPLNFGNVLLFKKHGRAGSSSSPTIKPGTSWDKTFEEEGVYDVWAFAFGVFGTITVEE